MRRLDLMGYIDKAPASDDAFVISLLKTSAAHLSTPYRIGVSPAPLLLTSF